jgi:hypothetical protein
VVTLPTDPILPTIRFGANGQRSDPTRLTLGSPDRRLIEWYVELDLTPFQLNRANRRFDSGRSAPYAKYAATPIASAMPMLVHDRTLMGGAGADGMVVSVAPPMTPAIDIH